MLHHYLESFFPVFPYFVCTQYLSPFSYGVEVKAEPVSPAKLLHPPLQDINTADYEISESVELEKCVTAVSDLLDDSSDSTSISSDSEYSDSENTNPVLQSQIETSSITSSIPSFQIPASIQSVGSAEEGSWLDEEGSWLDDETKEEQGKWLEYERELLESNAEEYLKSSRFDSLSEVMDQCLAVRKDFYKHCSQGLKRTDQQVAKKCRIMFNSKRKKKVPELREGKWLKSEIVLLKSNAEEYLESSHLQTIREIMNQPSERKMFVKSCAEGLNRTYRSVFLKCKSLFNPKNHLGKYTPREEKHLLALLKAHKDKEDKWKIIGEELGRSAQSVRAKCTKQYSIGKWSTLEEDKLKEGVEMFTIKGNVDWDCVADFVGSKTKDDCIAKKNKMSLTLEAPLKVHSSSITGEHHGIKLIEAVNKLDVKFRDDVDWKGLSREGPLGIDVSPHDLKTRFDILVKKYVPLAKVLEFDDLMDVLKKNYVDKMKRKLNGEKVVLSNSDSFWKREKLNTRRDNFLKKKQKGRLKPSSLFKFTSLNKLELKKRFLNSAETLPSADFVEIDE